jgi:hypothetical protein
MGELWTHQASRRVSLVYEQGVRWYTPKRLHSRLEEATCSVEHTHARSARDETDLGAWGT